MNDILATPPLLEHIQSILELEDWHFEKVDDDRIECNVNGVAGSWNTRIVLEDKPDEVAIRIVSHLPVKVPEVRRKEMAEIVTRLNADFILGHFFLLFSTGEIGFYTAFDPMDAGLTKDMLLRHFYVHVQTVDTYFSTIMAVAFGGVSAEDAYKNVQAETEQGEEGRSADVTLQ